MKEQLKALFDLQEVDLKLAAARKALAGLDNGAAQIQQLVQIDAAVKQIADMLQKSEADLKDAELTLKSLEQKKQNFEKKLYAGEVTNPKELSSIEKEIEMLGKNRATLDEQILALYEVVEKQSSTIKDAKAKVDQLRQKADAKAAKYQEESKKLNADIAAFTKEREEKAKIVTDQSLLKRYESARAHIGSGVAKIINGQCGGCHVSVTSFTIRKLQEGTEYERCESCGRFLLLEE